MTLSADATVSARVASLIRRSAPLLAVVVVALVVAACAPGSGPVGSGGVAPSATPHPPLTPAQPGADPVSLLSWLFTPIFQVMFIIMVAVYVFLEGLGVPGAIGWAIVVLTLVVRSLVIPL